MKENALINKRTRQAIAILSFLTFMAVIIPFFFGFYEEPAYFREILATINIPWLWFFISREVEKRAATDILIRPTDTQKIDVVYHPTDEVGTYGEPH